jgi:Lon protease-like protein
MSESLEKVRGVKFLPLFPLPIVLMPNELLPLHIFEPRYRQMLKDIKAAGNNLFGLGYLANQDSAVPETGSIGCVAEVREVQMMDDGRSNILTTGLIRYRLEAYQSEADEPYLVGKVSFFEDEEQNREELLPLAEKAFALFSRITAAAHELSNEKGQFPDISQAEPEQLSFLIAAALNLDTTIKYEFLQMRSTIQRLTRLHDMMNRMVGNIEERASLNKLAKTNGHSKKKINF